MQYRTFGRVGWPVSEVGYGMWGMAGWTGSDDEESLAALDRAIELGCNFFDTAWAYGDGHSERLLGETLKRHRGKRLYVATKIPPKNRKWPARPEYTLDDVFPADYIREYTEKSLENIGVSTLDLQQFHVWSDDWADDDRWQRAVVDAEEREAGAARSASASTAGSRRTCCGRSRPGSSTPCRSSTTSSTRTPRTSCSPICQEQDIAVIARVPFDEGSLTGTLTAETTLARGGLPQPLLPPREPARHAAPASSACARSCPPGMTMPEMALRHILAAPGGHAR